MILESIDLIIFFSYSITFLFKNCFFFLSECLDRVEKLFSFLSEYSDSIEKLFFFSPKFSAATKMPFSSCRSARTASKCCFSSRQSSRQHQNAVFLLAKASNSIVIITLYFFSLQIIVSYSYSHCDDGLSDAGRTFISERGSSPITSVILSIASGVVLIHPKVTMLLNS